MASEELGLKMDGGFLPPIPPSTTPTEQLAVLNSIIDRLNDLLKVQTFSDAQSKRYVQGYVPGRWPDGDFGIAVSGEGADVMTVDFDQLIFAWDFTSNKQYIRGGVQVFYDPTSGLDIGQQGILPNGIGGSAWSKDGESVNDAFGV